MAVVARPDVPQLEAAWVPYMAPLQMPPNQDFSPLGLAPCYRIHIGQDYISYGGHACFLSRRLDLGALLWRCEKGGLVSWLITRPGQVAVVVLNISARLHLGNLLIKARMLSGAVAYEETWPSSGDVTFRALHIKIRQTMLVAGRIQSTHVLKVYGHKLLNPGTKIWSCTWSKAFFAKKMAKRRLREKTDPRFLALARCVPAC